MKNQYDPAKIEARWQRIWNERKTFDADLSRGSKYYVLEMFPYPSGHIHMGHVRNYSIGDVMARYRWARGHQVIHPMGWDAFGLPAENAAIDRGVHPWDWTYDNIDHMRSQLSRMGFAYEWHRELATCHPGYYRWEQLLFQKMVQMDLAYRKTQLVNFCPECNTVLANEQVIDGRCERCSSLIDIRELPGWYFRITRYAQELLDGLDRLEGRWDKRVIAAQRKWIGRSEGVEIDFPLSEAVDGTDVIKVFTTRPDTLYGVTFMSLAAEHPLALSLARGTDREGQVASFVRRVRAEDARNRIAEDFPKEGVRTGRACKNPLTGEEVPIFIANFVLMEYGTGAVMAVPAHDQRDFEFARRFDLPVRVVINPPSESLDPATMEAAYVDDGVQVNSDRFDGLDNRKGMEAISDHLEQKGLGRRVVRYRLRDWSVSRQRYWGCPIPVLYCDGCGVVLEKEENLPVVLPRDVAITGKGGSPLASHPAFASAECPRCGGPARRETDTFDTFVESSWYQHRFLCARHDEDILDREAMKAMPVDQYIGGIEHATGHLMYTRFFHRVLRDLGYVEGDEPADRLLCQGMVCMPAYSYRLPDGRARWVNPDDVDENLIHVPTGEKVIVGRSEKMSKSKLNVVSPERIIGAHGADTLRLFVLSDTPPEADFHWSDEGVEGARRFLTKVWSVIGDLAERVVGVAPYRGDGSELSRAARELRQLLHASLQRITADIEQRLSFNTALARLRELTGGLQQASRDEGVPASVLSEAARVLLQVLALYAPHVAHELWESIGGEGIVAEQPWPEFDEAIASPSKITVVVQVNGKLRGKLAVAPDAAEEAIRAAALEDEHVRTHIEGKAVKRVIYVPGRLVNIVVG